MTQLQTATGASLDHRPFATLGKADHGWLKANHHFSFAGYQDPARMNHGAIRVWNDDEIAARQGFPPHPHHDMEIITYVREGAITHRDDLGNEGRTKAGDVQVMSAGTGVTHSEFNLENKTTRIFQIWVMPRERGITPAWDQRAFPKARGDGAMQLLASGYGERDALTINADARVFAATLKAGEELHHKLRDGHSAYLVPANGAATVNGLQINARDGLAIAEGAKLAITASEETELVLVETRW